MFQNRISETPMTTQAANDYFSNIISGQSWGSDTTFLATLRALLAPRIQEGDRISLVFTTSNYSKDQVDNNSASRMVRAICESFSDIESEIHIHNFRHSESESNDACMRLMESSFEAQYEGWHRVEKVTVFFRKVFNVLCFIHPENKSVVIFTDSMDVRRMHYLQCGIFAFLPWYFDQQKGVTELEMALINSLREKKSDKYLDCLAKIAEQYDFQTARVKRLLKGFETGYERRQIEVMKSTLNDIIRNLENLDRRYADYLRQKTDTEATLLGMELKIKNAGEESEIMDYFLANRHLVLKNVDGTYMDFVVRAPLDYFDEDMARRYLNNRGSYFYGYTSRGSVFTEENVEMLMREIFVSQRLKVQFCSAYRFNLNGGVESIPNYANYGAECREYTPNPHIDRYNCMGNYMRIINERLKERDYIGALEQCIASCKSLNIGDSPVMHEFVSRFCERSGGGKNMRCVVMPDGSVLTPKEAIEWLLCEKAAREAAEAEAAAAAAEAEAAEARAEINPAAPDEVITEAPAETQEPNEEVVENG